MSRLPEYSNFQRIGQYKGKDLYAILNPGEEYVDGEHNDYSRLFVADPNTEEGKFLREAHKHPEKRVTVEVREDYEGMPTLHDLSVREVNEFGTTYRDPETGDDVTIHFSPEIGLAHETYMKASAMASFAKHQMARLDNSVRNPENDAILEEIERQETIKYALDSQAERIERNRNCGFINETKIMGMFSRRPEFQNRVPRDLFPIYAAIARPNLVRKDGHLREIDYTGYKQPILFNSREEEVNFMRILYESTGAKKRQEELDLLTKALPGLAPAAANMMLQTWKLASDSSKEHIKALYDSKQLMSEEPKIQPCMRELALAGCHLERIGETRGELALQGILSCELQKAIHEYAQKNLQGVNFSNLPSPKYCKYQGKDFEVIQPNPERPTEYFLLGPIDLNAQEGLSYERDIVARHMQREKDEGDKFADMTLDMQEIADKNGLRIVSTIDADISELHIDGVTYSIGDGGMLYSGDNRIPHMNEFVRRYLQPPEIGERKDYNYSMPNLVELAREVLPDATAHGKIDCAPAESNKLSIVKDGPDWRVMQPITLGDYRPSSDERLAWVDAHPDIAMSAEHKALFDAYEAKSPEALDAITKLGAEWGVYPKDYSTEADFIESVGINARVEEIHRQCEEWCHAEAQERFRAAINKLSEAIPADEMEFKTLSAGGFSGRMLHEKGVFYREVSPDERDIREKLEELHSKLLEESRGIFKAPSNVQFTTFDMKYHEGDMQKLPQAVRDILHACRDSLKAGPFGDILKKYTDDHYYDLMGGCSSDLACMCATMTEKDREAFAKSTVGLITQPPLEQSYESTDFNCAANWTKDDFLDPHISFEGVRNTHGIEDKQYNQVKEAYVNAFIETEAARITPLMEEAYSRMLTAKDVNSRLQMPWPGWYDGTAGELCMTDCHLNKDGEMCMFEMAKRSVREQFKACTYIKNGENDLLSGDIPNKELVERIKRNLPKDKPFKELSYRELMEAASRATFEQEEKARGMLLKQDNELFKKRAQEVQRIRRKKLEETIVNIVSAPFKGLVRVSQALEQM